MDRRVVIILSDFQARTVGQNFALILAHEEAIEEKLTQQAASIDRLDTKLTAVSENLTTVNGAVADIAGAITAIGAQLESINSQLTIIRGSICTERDADGNVVPIESGEG